MQALAAYGKFPFVHHSENMFIQMHSTNQRKIFYVPGMISLLTVPFLFFYFVNRAPKKQNLYGFRIVWVDTSVLRKYDETFNTYRGHFPPRRVYSQVILSGPLALDSKVLDSIQNRISAFAQSEDTLSGFHFVFGDKATYGGFIQVLDLLETAQAHTYLPFENNLWIYNLPRFRIDTVSYTPITCGTVFQNTEARNKLKTKKVDLQKTWRTAWPLLLGFVLLVASSFTSIIRKLKTGCYTCLHPYPL